MATAKRDFGRAFDIPVGSPGDNVAAEPQARYSSPARHVPGYWPEDASFTEHATAPSSSSIFSTISRFATSLTLEVWKIPECLIKRFTRPLHIRAVPVITEQGASKRRLIDAGLAPATPTRNVSAGGRKDTDVTDTPRLWLESPPTPPHLPASSSKSPEYSPGQDVDMDINDIDDSLDWSMDDVDSSIPSHNPQTGSPTGSAWLRRSSPSSSLQTGSPLSRKNGSPIGRITGIPNGRITVSSISCKNSSATKLQTSSPTSLQTVSPISIGNPQRPERKILTPRTRVFSPNTHLAMLSRSKATPMQKQLLKNQLRFVEKVSSMPTVVRQQDHTVPAVAANAHEASVRYRAELEVRQNQDADAQATAEQSYPHPVATIDNDLSHLPDASDINSSFDSLRSSPPSPAQKRTIRWAPQGRVKSYYVDECISDMLDSTLESIRSPVPKPNFEDDEDYDEDAEASQGVTFKEPEPTSDSDDSVDSPSLDDTALENFTLDDSSSFDDSPLEQSRPSAELLEELDEDFKQLLSKKPPPPPKKPLIAPLTNDERAKLDDLAAKSNNGRNGSYPIVPDKISARDFGTLLPEQFNGSAKAWLNDEIVNQYLATLVKTLNEDCGFVYKRGGSAPPYHAFSSHWYNSILRGVKTVERWAGRVGLGGKQFLDAKNVFFPICDGSHWRLLAVNPGKRTIEYLDSLGWDGSKYVAKLLEYLQHELKEEWKEEEWTVVELQRSSRQLNGSDCGVFVLLNALAVARGEEMRRVIACNGMVEARERLAITLLTGTPVELDY